MDTYFDRIWVFGLGIDTTCTALGMIRFLVNAIASCVLVPRVLLQFVGSLYLLLAICSPAMFAAYRSDICTEHFECEFGWGSIASIVGSLCFVGAGLSTLFLQERESTKSVEYYYVEDGKTIEAFDEDGVTVVVVAERENPDGTKTVTRTRQLADQPGNYRCSISCAAPGYEV